MGRGEQGKYQRMKPDEKTFEEHINDSLVERGGYRIVKLGNASEDFDAGRGLDLVELFAFVEATQAGEWGRLAKLHGGEGRARERFADRLVKKIGGHAKAMVVTSSRKHAVRMTRALAQVRR